MKSLMTAAVAAAASVLMAGAAIAAGGKVDIPDHNFVFDGPFGTYDNAQLQRGFQVYQNVCAGCHSLDYFSFRELQGIGFSEDDIKAIIDEWGYEVLAEPDEEGVVDFRAARLSDRWPNPYANKKEAAAIHGKAPPDLSLIAKARDGRSDYLHALLTGYYEEATPELLEKYEIAAFTDDGSQHLNKVYAGHVIAMAQPLWGEDVEYVDGTEATLEQVSEDVTAFLTYVADPHMGDRKRMGIGVIAFLIVFSGLAYMMHHNAARRAKARQKVHGGPWE